ncbi:MAG: pyridoxal-phosphate dependent enzyme, partial [Bacteroidales bacterium]|nr:pyridoxal-phosphate dependent enzyme [Bacteroidales bacterium]
VKFSVFVPSDVSEDTVKEISSHGQNLVISKGNYAQAKQEAAEYQKKYGTMLSSGNIDPLRVEAKRTMAFEFIRQLGAMPDVYMQAVAGGTGPISLDKGIRELRKMGIETKYPRIVLAQQDKCDPMVQGWENANAKGFPEGWEKDYPVIETDTKISILSTANPGMYPIVAPLVRNSNGTFLRVKEAELATIAKWIYDNNSVLLGPASIVCIAGFMEACRVGAIHNGDKVLLNIGENCNRNSWFKNLVMQS